MSDCSILLPDAAELHLTRVISESDFLAVEVEVARAVVPCPGCGRVCSRRHSYYVRTLADLPSHGVRVQLRLRTRKFFCDARACSRRILERPSELLPTGSVAPIIRSTICSPLHATTEDHCESLLETSFFVLVCHCIVRTSVDLAFETKARTCSRLSPCRKLFTQ